MSASANYLAFDLGAESGRAVLGRFDGARLELEDVHRFPNTPVRVLDTLHWDALRLFHELKQGLRMAVHAHGNEIEALGIDTWGVDFALLGRDDALLANPRHYRDAANEGMMELAFATVPRDEMFERTGIQFMRFNTVFQLLALKNAGTPALDSARTLLMMPDLLNFWFTGAKSAEFSIATTTQLYDPRAGAWATDLMARLALPANLLQPIVPTGTPLGTIRPDISAEAGCGAIQVIAPAEHDTGSAVVAVPASTPDYAYISSGTWSLMGIESQTPLIDARTRAANFTNEGGAGGTIRVLKNIMGLWLVQECRRTWARQGDDHSYADLAAAAERAPAFGAIIDPDDVSLMAPTDMPAAIAALCARSGQSAPVGPGAMVRCCLESLALKYRWVLERLEEFRGRRIEVIHIVGGGTQNRLLCQLAADATGRTVIAGPVEATAIGNVLMQAMGTGRIASVAQAREIVRRSFALTTYEPTTHRSEWDAAYSRFVALREKLEAGS